MLKSIVVAAGLALAPIAGASAGTLQGNFTTGTDTCPTATAQSPGSVSSYCEAVTDANIAAIIAAHKTIRDFGQVQDTNTDGTPKVNGNGDPVMRAATDAEVKTNLVKWAINAMLANATAVQKSAAAAAAAAGVPAITGTPVTP